MTWFLITLLAFPAQGTVGQLPNVPTLSEKPVLLDLFGGASGAAPKSVEEAVSLALAHHPDLKLAEAELRVAEARLVQTRMQVTKKITEDYHKLVQMRNSMKEIDAKQQNAREKVDKGVLPAGTYKEVQLEYSSAKTKLAQVETEFLLAVNPSMQKCNACHTGVNAHDWQRLLQTPWHIHDVRTRLEDAPAKNTSVDALAQHFDKRIKLDKQNNITLEQAFATLAQQLGITLRVKLPGTENKDLYRDIARISLPADEMPLRSWLQLIVDEYNSYMASMAPSRKEVAKRHELYVREYGLLLTTQDLAPSDAMTLQQMVQQIKVTPKK
jgi:hypothetical protein